MNFRSILTEIEKADPEVYEKLSGRRDVLKSFGTKVAVAALPFAIGSMFKKAYGKTTDAVFDALNFALKLEYFEYNFYRTANSTGALIPANDQAGFQAIEANEKAHVTFLINTITSAGGVPFTPKNYDPTSVNPMYVPSAYDFTGGHTYADVFSVYDTFLQIAQTFEDTNVHAYLGQMPSFLGNAPLLTMAMQIQCVEARHASFIRLIRRLYAKAGAAEYPAPWITNNIPPSIPLQPFYVGEDNAVQSGVEITDLPDALDASGHVPAISATAAFDEPFDKAKVLSLLNPFMVP